MYNFCPHCGKDLSTTLLEYFLDIARMNSGFHLKCPHCDQLIEVSVKISFDLRKLPLPDLPVS
jgi:transcription elongation factor Elf1